MKFVVVTAYSLSMQRLPSFVTVTDETYVPWWFLMTTMIVQTIHIETPKITGVGLSVLASLPTIFIWTKEQAALVLG
jgi:hypothetical protein